MAHQAQLLGLGGADGPGGEDQLHSVGDAHDPGQTLGSPKARGDPKTYLRLAKLGLFTGEADVAGHGQLTPASKSKAVDGRNGGLGQSFQL